jgi:hypothetical protein
MRKNIAAKKDDPNTTSTGVVARAGARSLEEDPNVKLEIELKALLEFPETAFTPGKLANVEPENWKNVGVSIVHACKIMKEHSLETEEHLTTLKQFIDKFSARVFHFMKVADMESTALKTKVIKDLQNMERTTEDKMKAFKSIMDSG